MVDKVVGHILITYSAYYKVHYPPPARILRNVFRAADKVYGYFDGATQNENCGGGFSIYRDSSFVCFGIRGGGKGTNTKAELLGIWTLLMWARQLGIQCISVMGDSKMIIDWLNCLCVIKNITHTHRCDRIRALAKTFTEIEFRHIYRELNTVADKLSKEALGWKEGLSWIKVLKDGKLISHRFCYSS
jgi:ribonuclease HI